MHIVKYGALLGLQALVGRIVLDSADIVRDGDLSRLQQVGLELPDFLSLLTVSPTAIGVALGVRFLEEPHEFPPCCPHGSNLDVLHKADGENCYMIAH